MKVDVVAEEVVARAMKVRKEEGRGTREEEEDRDRDRG